MFTDCSQPEVYYAPWQIAGGSTPVMHFTFENTDNIQLRNGARIIAGGKVTRTSRNFYGTFCGRKNIKQIYLKINFLGLLGQPVSDPE